MSIAKGLEEACTLYQREIGVFEKRLVRGRKEVMKFLRANQKWMPKGEKVSFMDESPLKH